MSDATKVVATSTLCTYINIVRRDVNSKIIINMEVYVVKIEHSFYIKYP